MTDKYWIPLEWVAVESEPPGLLDGSRFIGAAKNNLYTVFVYELPGDFHHLSIKRFDKSPCRDWRHFQWIKNEICGAEREAIELFPAESRLLDGANQFHLWVLPEGLVVPIGVTSRAVLDQGGPLPGASQRAYDDDPDRYLGHEGLLYQKGQ